MMLLLMAVGVAFRGRQYQRLIDVNQQSCRQRTVLSHDLWLQGATVVRGLCIRLQGDGHRVASACHMFLR